MQGYSIHAALWAARPICILRGMNGQVQQGAYHWQPSLEFIEKLDQILGYLEQKKSA